MATSERGCVTMPDRTGSSVVLGVGVPHTPVFPELVGREPNSETSQHYKVVRDAVEAARPDAIVMFDCDHINTFFLDNWPTLCIGAVSSFTGPVDDVPGCQRRLVPGHEALGEHLLRECIGGGFDVSRSAALDVDHSVFVPLALLSPDFDIPVIPVFVNGFVEPLPAASRCFEFGQAVRAAIEAFQPSSKVAIFASGSFSLEMAGPRSRPGQLWGIPDRLWAERVCELMAAGRTSKLVNEITEDRIHRAGNVAGEVLSWACMLGATEHLEPTATILPEGQGHAFAVRGGSS